MATIRVEFVKTHPNARMPEYAESQAAGADLFAPVDTEIVPFKATLVKTGLTLAYLEPGYEIQVRSRSGNALNKDFVLANGIGTVDSSYRSDVGVILKFLPPHVQFQEPDLSDLSGFARNMKITQAILAHWERWATTPLKIKAGDKIAQIVCKKVERMQFSEVQEVTDHTQREAGGFGSTDRPDGCETALKRLAEFGLGPNAATQPVITPNPNYSPFTGSGQPRDMEKWNRLNPDYQTEG